MSVGSALVRSKCLLPLSALLTVTLAGGTREPSVTPETGAFDLGTFLSADAGFPQGEIRRVHRGEVIVRALNPDDETVGIAAAVLVAVPPAFYVEQLRRIEEFKQSPEVQQIGRLGTPPSARDFAPLSLDAGELGEARRCRAGDCEMKLDARGIDRLRAVPAQGDVMGAVRAHLADYASAYLAEGNAALITYHDRGRPQALLGEFERILGSSPALQREWPDLHAALALFSGTLPDGLESFVYWSKEKVGPRPVVSLTHVIIRPPRDGVAVVASKQIYASHYTTASLGLTVLVDQSAAAGPRTLVVYLNRTRVDTFGGLLGGLKRPVVRSRARSGAERMMVTLRTKLESEFRQSR